LLPQAGAEEASAGLEVAARKERMMERTPRVDWAELLRRTFDFDVFVWACPGYVDSRIKMPTFAVRLQAQNPLD
jgi:hypothetical protein